MRIYRRTVVIALVSLVLAAPELSIAQVAQDSGHGTSQTESAVGGVHDFDFLVGHWRVHHRKLKKWLANSHELSDLEGTLVMQKLMDGFSNVDGKLIEASRGS